ncbi:MAG: Crp/Fnr family transcriptional regulator [Deltaproteobacteria bacterium]
MSDAAGRIDALISSFPLFEGQTRETLRDLATIAEIKRFNRGQLLFLDGDPGNGFYVLSSGRVKIFKLSPDGKEQILHIFGPGEPFGEATAFEGIPFPASAQALQESEAVFFPRDRFVALIRKDPTLALTMLAVLSRRLKKFTVMIEHLSLRDVPGRLAAYLLLLRERQGGANELDLDLRKGLLASLLGTVPETLSRILARMSSHGLIQVDGSRIRILDGDGMEALAEGTERLE